MSEDAGREKIVCEGKEKALTRPNRNYHANQGDIGIDVHCKSYTLPCLCAGVIIKRCHMPAAPVALGEFCCQQFPGARSSSA